MQNKKYLVTLCALSLLPVLITFSAKTDNLVVKADEEPGTVYPTITDKVVLKVYNSYDYIYVQDILEGYEEPDLIDQFYDYAKQYGFENIEVIYDCFDTNETMYAQMGTGKTGYDLICPSDYMIQKMCREGMLQPLNREDKDQLLFNYYQYASHYLRNRLENILTPNGEKDAHGEDVIVNLSDYAVGYTWGTLGVLFNPYYPGYDTKQVIKDMEKWDVLWNPDYSGTISIKDSLRDTYAAVLMDVYGEEVLSLYDQYQNEEISALDYNRRLQEFFDLVDDDTLNAVKNRLDELKYNIFGLEVDSGKADIVQGKIGMNLAWSGDAVYSMDLAEEQDETLLYDIPRNGSNIWIDAWCLTKNPNRSDNVEKLAYVFLNFLSDPKYAAKNMDYTGYTVFTGGDDILELVRDWYDIRTDELYTTETQYGVDYDFDVGYFLEEDHIDDNFIPLDYSDCMTATHDSSLDETVLYYNCVKHNKNGDEISSSYEVLYADPEEHIKKTYGDLLVVDDEEVQEENGISPIDLSYFFRDTLEEYEDDDMIFYSDDYYFEYEDEETGETYFNDCVGGAFFCQYPDEETITRCCVMKDYGDKNDALVKMWEKFKSNALPTWAVILFVAEVGSIIGFAVTNSVKKKRNYRLRQERKNNIEGK